MIALIGWVRCWRDARWRKRMGYRSVDGTWVPREDLDGER